MGQTIGLASTRTRVMRAARVQCVQCARSWCMLCGVTFARQFNCLTCSTSIIITVSATAAPIFAAVIIDQCARQQCGEALPYMHMHFQFAFTRCSAAHTHLIGLAANGDIRRDRRYLRVHLVGAFACKVATVGNTRIMRQNRLFGI